MDTSVVFQLLLLLTGGAIAVYFLWRIKRSQELKKKFRPAYEYAVREIGDQSRAEKELGNHAKRVKSFKLRTLPPQQNRLFAERWRSLQGLFVDDPSRAVHEVDRLVKETMNARGYPVDNFEKRAADISVRHPRVVQNYRAAEDIVNRNSRGEATTEDLRMVMVYYRELFQDLLEIPRHRARHPVYEEFVQR